MLWRLGEFGLAGKGDLLCTGVYSRHIRFSVTDVGPHFLISDMHRSLRVHYQYRTAGTALRAMPVYFRYSRRQGLAKRYKGRRI